MKNKKQFLFIAFLLVSLHFSCTQRVVRNDSLLHNFDLYKMSNKGLFTKQIRFGPYSATYNPYVNTLSQRKGNGNKFNSCYQRKIVFTLNNNLNAKIQTFVSYSKIVKTTIVSNSRITVPPVHELIKDECVGSIQINNSLWDLEFFYPYQMRDRSLQSIVRNGDTIITIEKKFNDLLFQKEVTSFELFCNDELIGIIESNKDKVYIKKDLTEDKKCMIASLAVVTRYLN